MKIKALETDYDEMFTAIKKLTNNETLDDNDLGYIREIVAHAEGIVYPNIDDYAAQVTRMKQLNELDREAAEARKELGVAYAGSPSEDMFLKRSMRLVEDSVPFENEWC